MNYSILLVSYTTKLYGLLFYFIFLTNIAYSQEQTRFFVGVGIGPNVSFNRLESDKPLPNRIDVLQRAGISFDFFLEYTLTNHLSLQANIKTAARKTGIRYEDFVSERCTGAGQGDTFRYFYDTERTGPRQYRAKTEFQPIKK